MEAAEESHRMLHVHWLPEWGPYNATATVQPVHLQMLSRPASYQPSVMDTNMLVFMQILGECWLSPSLTWLGVPQQLLFIDKSHSVTWMHADIQKLCCGGFLSSGNPSRPTIGNRNTCGKLGRLWSRTQFDEGYHENRQMQSL